MSEQKKHRTKNFEESDEKVQRELDHYLFNEVDSISPIFTNVVHYKLEDRDDSIFYRGDLIITLRDGSRLTLKESSIINPDDDLYEYGSNGIKYAVKISKNWEEVEDFRELSTIINIRDRQFELKQTCSSICSRVVISAKLIVILMPFVDGDLVQLDDKKPLTRALRVKMLEDVREHMNCILSLNRSLNNIDYGYMNLSPENILYKHNEDGTYTFTIKNKTDISPSRRVGTNRYWKSPIWIHLQNGDKTIVESKNMIISMRYMFGMFALYILELGMNIDIQLYNSTYDEIENVEDRKQMSQRLFKLATFYGFKNPESYKNLIYDGEYQQLGYNQSGEFILRTDMY